MIREGSHRVDHLGPMETGSEVYEKKGKVSALQIQPRILNLPRILFAVTNSFLYFPLR
jgi:hypothetical protein